MKLVLSNSVMELRLRGDMAEFKEIWLGASLRAVWTIWKAFSQPEEENRILDSDWFEFESWNGHCGVVNDILRLETIYNALDEVSREKKLMSFWNKIVMIAGKVSKNRISFENSPNLTKLRQLILDVAIRGIRNGLCKDTEDHVEDFLNPFYDEFTEKPVHQISEPEVQLVTNQMVVTVRIQKPESLDCCEIYFAAEI